MPAKTPDHTVSAILRSIFDGLSTSEAAQRNGVSPRTVHNKLKDFKKRVKEAGLRVASREMNINVDQIVKVAQEKWESGLSFKEITVGASVAAVAENLGLKTSTLKDDLNLIYTEVLHQDHSPDEFIACAYELSKIRQKLKLPIEGAVEKYRMLKTDIDNLTEEKERALETKNQVQDELDEALEAAEITREELRIYNTERETLLDNDLSPVLVPQMANLLKNFKQQGYEAKPLIEFYKKVDNQEKTLELLQNKTQTEEDRNNNLLDRNNALLNEIKENEETVKASKILKQAGIGIPQAAQITQTVKDIASKRGINKVQAVDKLRKDLEEYYDQLIGFEVRLNILKDSVTAKQEYNQSLTQQNNHLKEENKNIIDNIEKLRSLNEKGVRNNDIITWSRILEENNLDPITLRTLIKELDGLPAVVRHLRSEEAELSNTVSSLRDEVDVLNAQIDGERTKLHRVEEETANKIINLQDQTNAIIQDLEERIFDETKGLKPLTGKIVDNTLGEITKLIKKAETQWSTSFNKMDASIWDSAETVAQLESRSYEAGIVIGQLVNLESVTKLVNGEPISRIEANIAMLSLISLMLGYLQKQGYRNSREQLGMFLNKYIEEAKVGETQRN